MTNVWINPVVDAMYGAGALREALGRLGFRVVACREDHAGRVRARYADAVARRGGRTVVDMRCPAAAARFRALAGDDRYLYPDIEPILAHCAREVCAGLGGEDCLIVTPCESLAAYGRGRAIPHARFLTWKFFCVRHHVEPQKLPPVKRPEPGPVPPGFFRSLPCETRSLSGAAAIAAYGKAPDPRPPALLELLDCPGGCTGGDGV